MWSSARRRGVLLVVSAPSGAGKTSLVSALAEHDTGVAISVSHTTRAPRPAERDGRHYHFVDEATFERMAADGDFVEHARVFGRRYGTARATVEREFEAGRDVVLEIDWQGARQVRERVPDAVSVFVLPPSATALAQRLDGRGQDSAEVIASRMREAASETAHWDEFDYLVVNDRFDDALAELSSVLRAERLRRERRRDELAGLVNGILERAGQDG